MHNLSAAVIGVGFVGKAHLEALRRLDISIAGVLRRAQTAADRRTRSYRSFDELVTDPAVSVVHICTPNVLHYEQASAAIRAGKHAMCEKPLAMNSNEGTALVDLARAQRVAAAVTYNLRYYPLCQEARAIVQSGRIGEPRLVHGSYLQDWLFQRTDWNWRLEPESGGKLRAVADIGTHWMDLVTWITARRITEVCADLATVIPTRRRPRGTVETFQKAGSGDFDEIAIETEDYASILLRLEGDVRGVFSVSQISAGRKNRMWFEIDGSEGSLAFDAESPNVLWIGSRQEPNRVMIKDPSLMSAEARGYAAYPGGHAEGYADTFVQLFKDFYAYIAAGDFTATPRFPTFDTGQRELVLCEAIARSASERRWVTID